MWKNTNWKSVFGTDASAYVTGDSGVFIEAVYTKEGCNMTVGGGACSVSKFVHLYNSAGIYAIHYDIGDCYRLNGGTGIASHSIPYYTTADSYTLSGLGYSNFKGWVGDNGNTPQERIVIPAGSTGEKHYRAVCENE